MLRPLIRAIRRDRRGHGLAEYCLAAAFIALVALGFYIRMSGGLHDLWNTANTTLDTGNSARSTDPTDEQTSLEVRPMHP